jgi:hypothetical protein
VEQSAALRREAPIAAAIALAPAIRLNNETAQTIQPLYEAVKAILKGRYPAVDLTSLEERPTSAGRRLALVEDLAQVGADTDSELASVTETLIEAIERKAPGAVATAGIDVQRIRVGLLLVQQRLTSTKTISCAEPLDSISCTQPLDSGCGISMCSGRRIDCCSTT